MLMLPVLFAVGAMPQGGSDVVISGPRVSSSKREVEPGGRTVLTIDGFDNSRYVQISICGNEARRGSADCNMSASEGVEVSNDKPLTIEMPVAAPPVDCPCVVRVVGQDSNEVAVTPIVVTGHPVGPTVDPPAIGDVVAASITAKQVFTGALDAVRSDLGGRTAYEVTVKVKNLATTPLKQVIVSASAGGSANDDSLVSIPFDDPGLIGVGQTWEQTVTVTVPAPAFGTTEWKVAVSGAGPTVIATSTTHHRPVMLIVLAMILVFIIWLLFVRWRTRRRAAREAAAAKAAKDAARDADGENTPGVEPAEVVGVGQTNAFSAPV
jgi:hypothetical protein